MSEPKKSFNDTQSELLALLQDLPPTVTRRHLYDIGQILCPGGLVYSAGQKPQPDTLQSSLTEWLTDVLRWAPSGKAEIYLSRFGTHVSVSWQDAPTEN
ncbi:MAG: hypothetical protein KGL35_24810 [Bradyrhizobium sp.]|nr:hypothetical protein [Bradyrhizobium sp.]